MPHPFDFAQGRLFAVFEGWGVTDLSPGIVVPTLPKIGEEPAVSERWQVEGMGHPSRVVAQATKPEKGWAVALGKSLEYSFEGPPPTCRFPLSVLRSMQTIKRLKI